MSCKYSIFIDNLQMGHLHIYLSTNLCAARIESPG